MVPGEKSRPVNGLDESEVPGCILLFIIDKTRLLDPVGKQKKMPLPSVDTGHTCEDFCGVE